MDKESASNTHTSDTTHLLPTSLKIEAIKSRPHQHYESGGARSTRMAINSASYVTTPCESPPDELRYVFSAKDNHHKAPSVAALAKADRLLQESIKQELSTSIYYTQAEDTAVRRSNYNRNEVRDAKSDVQHHDLSEAEEPLQESGPAPKHRSESH